MFDQVFPDKWAIEERLDLDLVKKFDIGVDLAHSRITFPLRDLEGQLVGISGRDFTGNSKSKYKVYDREYEKWGLPPHETAKSHLLWNGHAVYPMLLHEKMPVIVTEGFKACMHVVQAGSRNTVAILGSILSKRQRWLLERVASEIWLWLDNNMAGFTGTVLSGMYLGLPTRVILYPDEREQPSDLTPEEIQLALSRPKDFYAWLIENPEAREIYRSKRNNRSPEREE